MTSGSVDPRVRSSQGPENSCGPNTHRQITVTDSWKSKLYTTGCSPALDQSPETFTLQNTSEASNPS